MRRLTQITVAVAAALAIGNASADLILPPPGTIIGGVPLSAQFDDGFSYPTRILDYFFPTAGWDNTAGTGTLDVIITTRSSGQTNPTGFPDPITNPNTNPINDTWGAGGTASTNLLVSTLRDYLLATFNTTIPSFTFDQNETGGNPALFVNAKIEIIDPVLGVLHTWSFDNLTQAGDGDYDPNQLVLAPGVITIPNVLGQSGGGCSTGTGLCNFNNNVGSGAFDYVIYVPTMDLTPWADADNLFKVTWQFTGVDDGGEEITIFGFATTQVPEPGGLALMGLAGLGLFFARRRRQV
jgi:hypothetical protein